MSKTTQDLRDRSVTTAGKVGILAFAANPLGDLKLDEEIRAVEEELEQSTYRTEIEFRYQLATRRGDLIEKLDKYRPRIVHFSGHGSGGKVGEPGARALLVSEEDQGSQIYLVGPDERPVPVTQNTLAKLFKVRRGNIRLVVLNACYTMSQAEAISQVIDCVIGTNRAIGDKAARVFATRLYRTLADGGTVKQAFDDACVELEIYQIPEESTPVLMTRAGVDPGQLTLFGVPAERPTPENIGPPKVLGPDGSRQTLGAIQAGTGPVRKTAKVKQLDPKIFNIVCAAMLIAMLTGMLVLIFRR